MNVKLVAFGIAKDILQLTEMDYTLSDHAKVGELKNALIQEFPAFEKLQNLRFAINEDYQEDDFVLREGDEVVIIPPVSGG